uniref:Uncharacterized protein n=1 Tax=Clastoptera arizonana TaxID=38151 RepID=A0A1B6DDV7_9HEMI
MKRRAVISYQDYNEGFNCAMNDKTVELVARSESLPVQIRTASQKKSTADLVELANEIQKADEFVKVAACNKLQVILEQVRFLKGQAEKVLTDALADNRLHHAACNFKKIPGKIYHLYKKRNGSGQTYFSMLSPEEWGNSMTDDFIGSYRLGLDMSWTPANVVPEKERELMLINKILETNSVPEFRNFCEEEKMMIEN